MLPLIIDTKGTEILDGPLKGINALDAHNMGQVLQFVSDAGGYINKKAGNPSAYNSHIQDLIASLVSAPTPNKRDVDVKEVNDDEANSVVPVVVKDKYSAEDKLLREACENEYPDDFAMQSYCIDKQQNALKTLRKGHPVDIPEKQFETIRKNAIKEYPSDFCNASI